jgi:hypothetical protein
MRIGNRLISVLIHSIGIDLLAIEVTDNTPQLKGFREQAIEDWSFPISEVSLYNTTKKSLNSNSAMGEAAILAIRLD